MKATISTILLIFFFVGAGQFGYSHPTIPTQGNFAGIPNQAGCDFIVGTAAVTFSRDEGKTLVPTAERLRGIVNTYGLTTLDTPNGLLAVSNRMVLRSDTGGCTWTAIGEIEPVGDYFPLKLVAAPGGAAYGWSESRATLVRIGPEGIVNLKSPSSEIAGLAVDPNDGRRLRLGGTNGIWESNDAGSTWRQSGALPEINPGLLYRVAFDPANLDRVYVGSATTGAFFSRDGGVTWKASRGFSKTGRANVFEFAVSPVRGKTVWAMGIDLADGQKHIYLSRNGGKTFASVVDQSAEVTLVNGPVMVAHPTDADRLYFVFGTFFQGYGTDLFRYDAAAGRLSKTHNEYHDINAIAFSRTDPSMMYFGLEAVDRGNF